MTAVANATPPAEATEPAPVDTEQDLVQTAQAACGWVMHHLVLEKHRLTHEALPAIHWFIGTLGPQLEGIAASEEELRAWASHLDSEITEATTGPAEYLQARGVVHSVPVAVRWHRPAQEDMEDA